MNPSHLVYMCIQTRFAQQSEITKYIYIYTRNPFVQRGGRVLSRTRYIGMNVWSRPPAAGEHHDKLCPPSRRAPIQPRAERLSGARVRLELSVWHLVRGATNDPHKSQVRAQLMDNNT